jgi:hypothetical protein
MYANNFITKVLVWLAALLVPVETLPVMACDCGGHSSQSTGLFPSRTDARPTAKCPRCAARSQGRHSCCGGKATTSNQQGSCCKARGSCCCCKSGNGGGQCMCSANKSAPVPDPLQNNSRTNNTKTSLSASTDLVIAVPVVVPPLLIARAACQPSFFASTSLERLSALCRLVI